MSRAVASVLPLIVLLVLCAGVTALAQGNREGDGRAGDSGASRAYEGRLSVQGNEPHTYLALSTEERVFRIVGPLAEELRAHQGQTVIVRGQVEQEGQMGRAAGLRVVEIVEAGPPARQPPKTKS
jgi:hypothetical protein